MTRRETYLDWNATAPLRPEVAAAVAAALARCGNPSSVHRWGRAARHAVERAREAVAVLIGAAPDGVIFVSGGTEANHLALLGSGRERILVSAVEHSSVLEAVPRAERIAVDGYGIVDLARLEELLAGDPRPALVSVMFANNETGVIQPVARNRRDRACAMAPSSIATRCRAPASCRSRRRRSAPISSASRRTSSAARRGSARWW